mmetsp:Transcript_20265/g.54563  ORF Transcript_20265/g.54563 Transcript_20265/m.54563 type:complete len:137 (+) Transcript_20265:56-466(+)
MTALEDVNMLPSLQMPTSSSPYACAKQPGESFLLSSTKYLMLDPITITVDLPSSLLDEAGVPANCDGVIANSAYCETASLPDARCPPVLDYFVSCTGSSICDQLFPDGQVPSTVLPATREGPTSSAPVDYIPGAGR